MVEIIKFQIIAEINDHSELQIEPIDFKPTDIVIIHNWIDSELKSFNEEKDTKKRWEDSLWSYDENNLIQKVLKVTIEFENGEVLSQEIEEGNILEAFANKLEGK